MPDNSLDANLNRRYHTEWSLIAIQACKIAKNEQSIPNQTPDTECFESLYETVSNKSVFIQYPQWHDQSSLLYMFGANLKNRKGFFKIN